jgi:hypothetical protein
VKRILVATDGSEGSNRAVDFAADLAKTYVADLLIINIRGGYGLSIELMRQFSDTDSAWFEELLKTRSVKILESARERARALVPLCSNPVAATSQRPSLISPKKRTQTPSSTASGARKTWWKCLSAACRKSSSTSQAASLWSYPSRN